MSEKDTEKRSAQHAINAKLYDRAIGNPVVKVFEQTISRKLGDVPVLAINGNTGALITALKTLGISSGDEVIVPAFCSPITTSSLLSVGAMPVFVDIRLCDYAIDPAAIEKQITERTKAIMVVHLFGQPALGISEVLKIAKRKSLPVIENAAQAFGGKITIDGKQRFVGTLGDIGCFTFFPKKPYINERGVSVMTFQNKEKLYITAKKLRAARANSIPRETGVTAILTKLKSFDQWLEQRRELAEYFTKQLSGIRGIILPESHSETENTWYRYVIQVARRDALFEHLFRTVPMHHHSRLGAYFAVLQKGHTSDDFPISEKVASEIISLPVSITNSLEDAAQVVRGIKIFFENESILFENGKLAV
ncbi:MAG: DegT/DnrJ/EryC1/StrS family aminotransferase [Candidatus Uhrbacteria bacterium]|nr:DegT/DnrJ/EryC1/StrS family aminotransferase [Candidatus Uhrbacteria bacterium]